MGKKGRERTRRVNSRKRALLGIIARNPGIHLRDLERKSGIALGALRNLLDGLMESEIIDEIEANGTRTFFPSRGIEREDRLIVALLRKPHLRSIVELLLEQESMTRKELSNVSGVPRTTLRSHLETLAQSDIINLEKSITLIDSNRMNRLLVLTRTGLLERMIESVIEIFDEAHL